MRRNISPEEKVNLAIDMTDTCVHVCVESLRMRYPRISEEELLEKVRERTMYNRRKRCEV